MVLRQLRRPSAAVQTWHYTWDSDDRLVAVRTPDGQHWRYRYDPLGRRIAKQRSTGDGTAVDEEIQFVWDGSCLAEQHHRLASGVGGDRVTTFDWEPDNRRPLAQRERGYPLRDAPQAEIDERFHAIVTVLAGAPAALLDTAGNPVWRQRATLWGVAAAVPLSRAAAGADSVDTPLRFPGQYHDAETGLNYNYHRYYDPAAARYVSGDPIGLRGGDDPHADVSNPVHEIDPLGLVPYAAGQKIPDTLFHYTNQAGHDGILASNELLPSLKAVNPKDARYGDGQYFTDIKPGTKTLGQLSAAFLRVPWAGSKFTHYIEVDVRGLNVIEGRPGVFVVPNSGPLDLAGRIISSGRSVP